MDAAQAVVVAVMPGRVGVQQPAERGQVGVRERLEDGTDDIGVGDCGGGSIAASCSTRPGPTTLSPTSPKERIKRWPVLGGLINEYERCL